MILSVQKSYGGKKMDKIITFRPYKVFDNGEDKFIFNIDTTAIYKVDDKTLKIA